MEKQFPSGRAKQEHARLVATGSCNWRRLGNKGVVPEILKGETYRRI